MARLLLAALVAALASLGAALKDGECEVCMAAMTAITSKLGPKRGDLTVTEKAIDAYCAKPPTVRGGSEQGWWHGLALRSAGTAS